MDVYVTDFSFQNPVLIENFSSMIWTDRYSAFGDFSISMKEDPRFFNLKQGKLLISSESRKVMMVETVDVPKQESGANLAKITGRSLEAFLQYRSAKHQKTSVSSKPEKYTNVPGNVMRYVVDKYCVNPTTAGGPNVIPNLSIAAYTGGGGNETINLDRSDVYSMVKNIADSEDLGFEIVRTGGSTLVFRAYRGTDKTNPANANFAMYSPDDDSLIDISTIESIANFRNNIRVIGAKTAVDVYASGYSASTSGFDRRTLVAEFSDIGNGTGDDATTVSEDQAMLRQKGRELLALPANKYTRLIDGDIPPQSYTAAKFSLGDLVLLRDTYGNLNRARITEHIWSSDGNETRHTPTFEAVI
jgi:hypothetical protein